MRVDRPRGIFYVVSLWQRGVFHNGLSDDGHRSDIAGGLLGGGDRDRAEREVFRRTRRRHYCLLKMPGGESRNCEILQSMR